MRRAPGARRCGGEGGGARAEPSARAGGAERTNGLYRAPARAEPTRGAGRRPAPSRAGEGGRTLPQLDRGGGSGMRGWLRGPVGPSWREREARPGCVPGSSGAPGGLGPGGRCPWLGRSRVQRGGSPLFHLGVRSRPKTGVLRAFDTSQAHGARALSWVALGERPRASPGARNCRGGGG